MRNSGVRTLFAVVASQGTRLSHSVWEECLWQMLFPLLRSVHHTAATSSREEVSCTKTVSSMGPTLLGVGTCALHCCLLHVQKMYLHALGVHKLIAGFCLTCCWSCRFKGIGAGKRAYIELCAGGG